ncbi:family 20 glycosylhydrolase [Pedobacter sp. UYEF25]
MKRTAWLIILSIAFYSPLFAQTDSNLVKSVPEIQALNASDTEISFPLSPDGYRVELVGTDHKPIVSHLGKITKPLVATKVNVYFQLISKLTDTIKTDFSREVIVQGKFGNRGINAQPFVIPSLREWHGAEGSYRLLPTSRIVISKLHSSTLNKVAGVLQKDLKAQTGFVIKIVTANPKKGDLFLTLNEKDSSIGKEGYYFNSSSYITISALKYEGLFWGTRTLLQLLEQNISIPKGVARDYPEFKVRGFVLDVGRKFFSLRFLQDYVKFMSYYKMNDFQVHLNDNGFKKFFNDHWNETYSAFRLENTTYPGLTANDGSYSKKDFIALQQLAKTYAVHIIPEIDAPAHALAFTKTIPEIGSEAYGMDHLDLHNPLSITVMENVFKEYLSGKNPVFIGDEVHIGTDEYAKKDAEIFRAFTDHMIKYIEGFGKKVRLWGALTHAAGITPVKVKNVTMNTWYNGYANPTEMKKLGYNQISTPDGWLYIVPAAGYYYDYLDVKNIYNKWTPSMIGDIQFQPGDTTILGGSFAVWNDIVGNGISEKDVHDRVFPAMQVLSEKMWVGNHTGLGFEEFQGKAANIGEGPASNIRGKIGTKDSGQIAKFAFDKADKRLKYTNTKFTKGINGNAIVFSGNKSYVTLPIKEIGYNYTISFWIRPQANPNSDITIFKSENASFKLKQNQSGKLGFSREGYDYDFNYTVPENIWTNIVVTGTNKGTSLYVNGKLQKKLYDNWIQYNDSNKTKVRKMETLFFPLNKIGFFNGTIDELKIWNNILSDEAIMHNFQGFR